MPMADIPSATSIHRASRRFSSIDARMRAIANAFVGRPYAVNPLGGGPSLKERLVIRYDAFDCVTFVETVLSMARIPAMKDHADDLALMRYKNGRVSWDRRLHYFSDWLAWNSRQKVVVSRTKGPGSISVKKTLSCLADQPPRLITLTVVPKRSLSKAAKRLRNGSVVAFATTRAGLDYFHVGLVFVRKVDGTPEPTPLLFHATKSRGGVVAEPLADFLRRNRMRGITFTDPCPVDLSVKGDAPRCKRTK